MTRYNIFFIFFEWKPYIPNILLSNLFFSNISSLKFFCNGHPFFSFLSMFGPRKYSNTRVTDYHSFTSFSFCIRLSHFSGESCLETKLSSSRTKEIGCSKIHFITIFVSYIWIFFILWKMNCNAFLMKLSNYDLLQCCVIEWDVFWKQNASKTISKSI